MFAERRDQLSGMFGITRIAGQCRILPVLNGQVHMPTVLRVGRYRFVFFSNEGNEPPHIHAKADRDEAKFWLDPIALAANYGFKAHELNEIERIIRQHAAQLREAWHEHLG